MNDGFYKVQVLLGCWAEWRGTVRKSLLSHMQPRCTIGRLVKGARQGGEMWAHNEVAEIIDYDDALMLQVSKIVSRLPVQQQSVVMAEYVDYRGAVTRMKARKLRMSDRHYRRILKQSHEDIFAKIDWRRWGLN